MLIFKVQTSNISKDPITFEKFSDLRVKEEDESSINSNIKEENIPEIDFLNSQEEGYSKLSIKNPRSYSHLNNKNNSRYSQLTPLRNARFSGSPLENEFKKYSSMMHFVRTNFQQMMKNKKDNVFTEEDLKNNDVYHRLFKDSKIKHIKDNDFTEFLKFK